MMLGLAAATWNANNGRVRSSRMAGGNWLPNEAVVMGSPSPNCCSSCIPRLETPSNRGATIGQNGIRSAIRLAGSLLTVRPNVGSWHNSDLSRYPFSRRYRGHGGHQRARSERLDFVRIRPKVRHSIHDQLRRRLVPLTDPFTLAVCPSLG